MQAVCNYPNEKILNCADRNRVANNVSPVLHKNVVSHFTVIYLFFFSFLFYLILRYCYRMITQITNVCIKSETDYIQN